MMSTAVDSETTVAVMNLMLKRLTAISNEAAEAFERGDYDGAHAVAVSTRAALGMGGLAERYRVSAPLNPRVFLMVIPGE